MEKFMPDVNNEQMKKDILELLGFQRLRGHGMVHALTTGSSFDFSALSVEGIVYEIYQRGVQAGKKELRKDLKELLNVHHLE